MTTADQLRIGLFWLVPTSKGRIAIADQLPLDEAVTKDDHLVHPASKIELWQAWRDMSAAERTAAGVPGLVCRTKPEGYTSGEVAFYPATQTFVIRSGIGPGQADLIAEVADHFGLADARWVATAPS